MPDREKYIKILRKAAKTVKEYNEDVPIRISLEFVEDILALLQEQPEIVRCKDCVHRGKVEKCVLAAIAAEKGYPLFMLDNRGEWSCADGERR